MIKRILVPLDTSAYSKAAIYYSLFVARRQNAEVTGLALVDKESIEKTIGPNPIGGLYWAEKIEKQLTEDAKKQLQSVIQTFQEECDTQNIPHQEMIDVGSPKQIIFNYNIFYDLVVIGLKTNFNFEVKEKSDNTLTQILDHSITPILAVPEELKEIKNVLIGFDGSVAAARALQRFVHLAIAKDLNIKVLIAAKPKEEAKYLKTNLKNYLDSYELNNYSIVTENADFKEIYQNSYEDWADVVVIGAHSKKAIKDFFVGSVTQYLINKGDKLIFIGI